MNNFRKKKVLLVEDIDDIRFVYAEILSKDFEVITAATGQEALLLLTAEKPELVILDLHIPGITGQEVYMRLRQEVAFRELPVIFVTGSVFDIEACKSDRFSSTLFKPFRVAELKSEISKFLETNEAHAQKETASS